MNNKKTNWHQTESSVKKNTDYFLGEYQSYSNQVGSIDTYKLMRDAVNSELVGVKNLLDIGNGGVFDYDTGLVKSITGVDLFLDNFPKSIQFPANVHMIQGSALDLPKDMGVFDAVVMVMLLHHLVGRTAADCRTNVRRAIDEVYRVISPGGKFIIMESCVPSWFYQFEKLVFQPSAVMIEKFLKHPPTLHFPSLSLTEMMKMSGFKNIKLHRVPKGRFIIQYGFKVPSFITPVQPTIIVGHK